MQKWIKAKTDTKKEKKITVVIIGYRWAVDTLLQLVIKVCSM